MQARASSYKERMEREIDQKEGLLKDIEEPVNLKIMPMVHYRKNLIRVSDYSLRYPDAPFPVFEGLNFEINQGERVFLSGGNGCGKSSVIKTLLQKAGAWTEEKPFRIEESGTFEVAGNLVLSYINQDTSQLRGSLKDYARQKNLDYSLLLALLRQLDFERGQFDRKMEDFSEGQKKKVLIAASLITPAHLYIWDEPLNYIDIFSRMQIERLIEQYRPTMLLVEHDVRFREKIATRIVEM